MIEQFYLLLDWLSTHETALWWMGAMSALMFIGTLVAIPLLVARIPADYFMHDHSLSENLHQPHPVVRILTLVLKNVLGVICIIAGILMLVLPGQGILTILIGLMLMNFPGKQNLEIRIINNSTVTNAINWMRSKTGHKPLQLPSLD